jgi:hypothetical protein
MDKILKEHTAFPFRVEFPNTNIAVKQVFLNVLYCARPEAVAAVLLKIHAFLDVMPC